MLVKESMHIISLALCIRCAQCIANIKSDTYLGLIIKSDDHPIQFRSVLDANLCGIHCFY